jgi:hypothetical protein
MQHSPNKKKKKKKKEDRNELEPRFSKFYLSALIQQQLVMQNMPEQFQHTINSINMI